MHGGSSGASSTLGFARASLPEASLQQMAQDLVLGILNSRAKKRIHV